MPGRAPLKGVGIPLHKRVSIPEMARLKCQERRKKLKSTATQGLTVHDIQKMVIKAIIYMELRVLNLNLILKLLLI